MSTFLTIVGSITVLGVTTAAIIGAVALYVKVKADADWARDQTARRDAIRGLGATIKQHAYWFTESTPAWVLMERLGTSLAEEGRFEVDMVRTKWRNDPRMKADKETEQPTN